MLVREKSIHVVRLVLILKSIHEAIFLSVLFEKNFSPTLFHAILRVLQWFSTPLST